MNAAAPHPYEPALSDSLKGPLIGSTLFHIALFAMTMITLPFVTKSPPLEIITPVAVEFVEAKETAAPKPALPKPQQIEKPKPPEPPPAPEPEAEPTEPEKAEAPPPKPKPKAKPKPKEKTKPKTERSFDQLLKDFTPREDVEEQQPEKVDQASTETQQSAFPNFAKELTMSELDALQNGIAPCWSFDAGGRFAENLIVELRVTIHPDMRVKTVQVLDQLRYTTDNAFRAAADAASRALRNPNCSRLNLPPEKYKDESFKFVFDPRLMLGY